MTGAPPLAAFKSALTRLKRLGLARIFHSLSHRYDHLPAGGSYDGGSQGICGLVSKPPLRGEIMRPRTTENSSLAQENPRNLAGLLAERSGGGFASSPDVPASALGPRIIDSLHAGCRVERETSGLARRCRNQTFLQEATEETGKMNEGEEASLSSLHFLP